MRAPVETDMEADEWRIAPSQFDSAAASIKLEPGWTRCRARGSGSSLHLPRGDGRRPTCARSPSHGGRLDLVQRDVGLEVDASLDRPPVDCMLDAIALGHLPKTMIAFSLWSPRTRTR
jgi:hypothetical protein